MNSSEVSAPIFSMENISKTFKQGEEKLAILENASLSINRGEMVSLVGPSGCGKSTILHIAGLLDKFDSGKIIINGNDVSNISDKKRTKIRRNDIGFIYQFHHLLPEFTALENIAIPKIIDGVKFKDAKAEAMVLLEKMKLSDRANHKPSELSGGEQQRIAIARALVNKPSLILADEPTGNLDPENADYVFSTLIGLVKDSNISMLMVTHNMELGKKSDNIITIENKKIVQV